MKSNNNHDQEEELFEWERREREVYNRFKNKCYQVGIAFIILSAFYSINWLIKLITLLFCNE